MSTSVIVSDRFSESYDKLDGSIKNRVMDFIVKLQRDPTSPGLDLKTPTGVEDRRIKTARVNDFWRAVVIELPDALGYIAVAVKPHDDAYVYAARLRFGVNEVTGAVEIVNQDALSEAVATAAGAAKANTSPILSVRKRELLRFGIAPDIADELLLVTDEDLLLDIATELPAPQASALLDLAAGREPDDVWADLIAEEAGDVDVNDVVAALNRPLTRLSFSDVSGEANMEELRSVLEGDFGRWRVWLHPLQRRLANHDGWNGPFRLTGGAGTGKTVTAIHRARHLGSRLARESEGESAAAVRKVLLTTFTRNLAQTIEGQLVSLAGDSILERVDVVNIDAIARRIATSTESGRQRVESARLHSIGDRDIRELWESAKTVAQGSWDSFFLEEEWLYVVLGQGITGQAEYLRAPRSGRGQRLTRPQRADVWKVIEAFVQLLRAQNLMTFTEVAALAAATLEADASDAPGKLARAFGYKHAVVDEAQDLHPAHWRMLRALIPMGSDDLFIVGDAHQRIYGRPTPLSRFGIETRGRSRRLTINYRTSRQILHWCLAVVDEVTDDLDDSIETLAGARSEFSGPQPILNGYGNVQAENLGLIQELSQWHEDGLAWSEIGVVVRELSQIDDVRNALKSAGIESAEVSQRGDGRKADAVRVMGMHRAKGLEYRGVALVRLGAYGFPARSVLSASGPERDQLLTEERNLLYVAASRARERLYVSWTGEPSSLLVVPG